MSKKNQLPGTRYITTPPQVRVSGGGALITKDQYLHAFDPIAQPTLDSATNSYVSEIIQHASW